MFKKLLLLAPHQDDETIGCGGLIQHVLLNNGEVHICIFTGVDKGKKYNTEEGAYEAYSGINRNQELDEAIGVLSGGRNRITVETFFDTSLHHRLDTLALSHVIDKIEEAVRTFKPDAIAIPSISWDQDHKIVNRACMSVVRPHFYCGTVIEYETLGESSFDPNLYLPMNDTMMNKKLRALEKYATQGIDKMHLISSDSITAKSIVRGRAVHEMYAEAFYLKRMKL